MTPQLICVYLPLVLEDISLPLLRIGVGMDEMTSEFLLQGFLGISYTWGRRRLERLTLSRAFVSDLYLLAFEDGALALYRCGIYGR